MYLVWSETHRMHTKKKTLGYKERCPKKRATYRQELAALQQAGKSVVYADESGFRDESFRRYGYAPKGEAVYGLISSQRTRTTTLLAARFQGTFTAPRLLEGGCKSADFNEWLAEAVCPRLTANHVLVLDNAMLHKTSRTRELIETTGASLLFCFCRLIPRIIIRLNMILPISSDTENITLKGHLTRLFKCIHNSIIHHSFRRVPICHAFWSFWADYT